MKIMLAKDVAARPGRRAIAFMFPKDTGKVSIDLVLKSKLLRENRVEKGRRMNYAFYTVYSRRPLAYPAWKGLHCR